MGRGGYTGGGTIISLWSLARADARRRFEETTTDTSGNRKRKSKRNAAAAPQPVAEVPPKVQAQRDAARAKPQGRIPKAMLERGAFLKAQFAAGVLLPTGKPNPKHPANKKAKPK